MKAIRVILTLIGLGLAGRGVYLVVEPPPGDDGIGRYIPAGMMFLFAILIFAVWLPMVTRTDHGKLLRTGEPASATIVEVTGTGGTIDEQPIFRFVLDVRRSDGSSYRATVRQIVARPAIGTLRPGVVVPVRLDPRRPSRVAIDSQDGSASPWISAGPTAPAGAAPTPFAVVPGTAPAAAWAAGAIPTARVAQSADMVRDGVPSTATVRSVSLTGATLGQLKPDAGPAMAADPMVLLVLDVILADGRTVTAQGIHRVPADQLPRLALGATVPVSYLAADPANTTGVDWDRLSRT